MALYHPSESHLDFNCPECVQIKWKGGQVPIAKRIFKLRVATIAPFAFYTITSFASVGITLSIAFLAFNLHFRKLKYVWWLCLRWITIWMTMCYKCHIISLIWLLYQMSSLFYIHSTTRIFCSLLHSRINFALQSCSIWMWFESCCGVWSLSTWCITIFNLNLKLFWFPKVFISAISLCIRTRRKSMCISPIILINRSLQTHLVNSIVYENIHRILFKRFKF